MPPSLSPVAAAMICIVIELADRRVYDDGLSTGVRTVFLIKNQTTVFLHHAGFANNPSKSTIFRVCRAIEYRLSPGATGRKSCKAKGCCLPTLQPLELYAQRASKTMEYLECSMPNYSYSFLHQSSDTKSTRHSSAASSSYEGHHQQCPYFVLCGCGNVLQKQHTTRNYRLLRRGATPTGTFKQ